MIISNKAIQRIAHILQTKETARHAQKKTEIKPQQDEVSLSPKAKSIQMLQRRLSEIPEVREDVVRRFKEQIDKGDYKVSSQDLAAKMLAKSDRESLD